MTYLILSEFLHSVCMVCCEPVCTNAARCHKQSKIKKFMFSNKEFVKLAKLTVFKQAQICLYKRTQHVGHKQYRIKKFCMFSNKEFVELAKLTAFLFHPSFVFRFLLSGQTPNWSCLYCTQPQLGVTLTRSFELSTLSSWPPARRWPPPSTGGRETKLWLYPP